MNEEEEKAIEVFKEILFERDKINEIEDEEEREIEKSAYFEEMAFDEIEIVLNLIEKQQKELDKEKEKREIAEENHKVLSLDLGKALKELGLYEDTIIADELVLEINKRYISKDKIKEKIEELGKKEKEELKGTKGQDRYAIKQEYMHKRSALQSLLEKE